MTGLSARHDVWCLTFAASAAAVAALAPLRTQCRVVTVPAPAPRSLARRAWTSLSSPLPDMALRNVAPAYAAALRQVLAVQPFDVVQAESIEMAGYGLSARRHVSGGKHPGPLLVLDEFNAEYVLQRRAALTDLRSVNVRTMSPAALRTALRSLVSGGYSLIQWRKLATYERRLLRRYDHVVVVSAEDRQALQRQLPRARLAVVPNGVASDTFDRSALNGTAGMADDREALRLVFTGSLDFRPNIDALVWFVRQVLPLVRARYPAARCVVVGRSPAPAVRALHDGVAVEVVGEVDDVRPFIAGAAVYVVPMRIGGGVRLKLLEALAMEAAVVSTTMGAEGVAGLADGRHLLLADTPAAFAAAVVRLLADPELRGHLGHQGRALVRESYDWRVIVPRLEQVYTLAPATSGRSQV